MKISTTVSRTALAVSLAFSLATPIAAFAAGPATVNLGTAGNYAVLAKTGISTTGTTAITGDIGVSPAAATYITGFGLNLDAYAAHTTSAVVTGKVYAPGYADPTPANLTTAIGDMQNAYTDAAGRAATVTELGAGNIGGLTLAPGVYKWGTDVTIPSDVTLSGSANDVWIFQIAQNLTVSSGAHITLAGGAQAANIFWQVAGQTTIGTTAVVNGNILDQTTIVLNTGAVLNGRALAQTAVTLDSNAVTVPVLSNAATPATPATPAVSATPPSSTSSGTSASPAVSATSATPSASATSAVSSGLSASQVQSIIDVLTSFNADASVIANVRASLGGTTTGSVTSAAVAVFKENLTVGSLGSEVKALQEYLNAHGYTVATTGAGSSGNETTKFGSATKAALVKYQKAQGIMPASGYFGALTRAAVNSGK